jgi:hypothetical protein
MKPVTVQTPQAELTVGASFHDPKVWIVCQSVRASILSDMHPAQAMVLAAALNEAAAAAMRVQEAA